MIKSKLEYILNEVHVERIRQVDKGYDHSRDDHKEPSQWHEDIDSYNGWARLMSAMGSPDKARNRYIQIAALAVAAVESIDRRHPNVS